MGKGVAVLLGGLPALFLAGLYTLPSSHGPLETLDLHFRLALHLFGFAPRQRVPEYGLIEPRTSRPSNGTIKEVQGFVTPEEFYSKYYGKEPVIFRGAATKEWGFDLECLTKSDKSVADALEDALDGNTFRVFKDQRDDSSSEFITLAEYRKLTEAAVANASAPMPYARAFEQSSLKTCRPVPDNLLHLYRHRFFQAARAACKIEGPVMFASFAKDTDTKMHIDVGDSFATHVYGRKKWYFLDPAYVADMKIWGFNLNLVYIAGYDVHREALPAHIPIKEVIANPGDILYFPSMTFHAVYNIDPVAIMVDDTAPDLIGSFRRHWFLSAFSILNPWTAVQAAKLYMAQGAFGCSELYYSSFQSKPKAKAAEGEL